jgi:prephenate dehydrogenase
MAVTHTNTENTMRSIEQLQKQLNRIEEKLDNQKQSR